MFHVRMRLRSQRKDGLAVGFIRDERTDKSAVGYVVFTDSFMSGWGHAEGGRSLYALAVSGGPLTSDECITVLRNGKDRSEMKRGRYVRKLPRLGPKDHMSVVDKTIAPRWYVPGAFAEDAK